MSYSDTAGGMYFQIVILADTTSFVTSGSSIGSGGSLMNGL